MTSYVGAKADCFVSKEILGKQLKFYFIGFFV